jgi:hypothetical protein
VSQIYSPLPGNVTVIALLYLRDLEVPSEVLLNVKAERMNIIFFSISIETN